MEEPLLPVTPVNLTTRDLEKRYTGVKIQANRDGQCLHVFARGGIYNGIPVTSVDCTVAVTWNISPGSGSVILAQHAPDFALDAGTNPTNGGKLKVSALLRRTAGGADAQLWTSYPGLPQQTWYLTNDNRIAITGGTQCLDQGADRNPQTWQCTTGNTNQSASDRTARRRLMSVWRLMGGPLPPIDEPDPVAGGHRIHSRLDGQQCISVMGGTPTLGASIELYVIPPLAKLKKALDASRTCPLGSIRNSGIFHKVDQASRGS